MTELEFVKLAWCQVIDLDAGTSLEDLHGLDINGVMRTFRKQSKDGKVVDAYTTTTFTLSEQEQRKMFSLMLKRGNVYDQALRDDLQRALDAGDVRLAFRLLAGRSDVPLRRIYVQGDRVWDERLFGEAASTQAG